MSKVYRVQKSSYGLGCGMITTHELLRSTEHSVWVPVYYLRDGERCLRNCSSYRWFEDRTEALAYAKELLDQEERKALKTLEYIRLERENNHGTQA